MTFNCWWKSKVYKNGLPDPAFGFYHWLLLYFFHIIGLYYHVQPKPKPDTSLRMRLARVTFYCNVLVEWQILCYKRNSYEIICSRTIEGIHISLCVTWIYSYTQKLIKNLSMVFGHIMIKYKRCKLVTERSCHHWRER